ncbi:PLD nuclease N-terminal domain-containing protein [Shouchella sp. JSM 1781072]|uniref:PLD nuclease N-terminal domain-containing protein n=1 Tax=Bacillaceae TaxID=186817 RepID=UPI000C07CE83|nr:MULTISPECIES: PLD nuclease N-terminal domain-containing protein [Bacillaceae]UTR07613.1 PLD nuclease N-terminal domain-containing protein [Alkalihalobacillus sp. LMS6]
MNEVIEIIQLFLPLILVQVLLMIVAFIDLYRRAHTRGPKWIWALVIAFINLFGPILYFLFGREKKRDD